MPRRGENIYKRKDGRWEGRYIKQYDIKGKAQYGYIYLCLTSLQSWHTLEQHFFALSTFFQLVTLPVELNASKRALQQIQANGLLYENEIQGAKDVLTAAALTYVAALAVSIPSLSDS